MIHPYRCLIGIETPGPVVNAPPPNYGIFSSNYHDDRNKLTIGDEGQIYATDYSYRPVVRGTLRRLKTIGSNTVNELDKGIIVNSVSSSNVTSYELYKVTTNNELTKSTNSQYYGIKNNTIHPDNQPELRLPLIPPSLSSEANYESLLDVDLFATNQLYTNLSPKNKSTKKRNPVVTPDISSSGTGQSTTTKEKPKHYSPTAIRQAPRAFINSLITVKQVIPVKEVELSIFPNLPRNPKRYARPRFFNIPLIVASDYLLSKKHDTLPDNSSQRLNLLYNLVSMRARFTRPQDNMFIRIEEVAGWDSCQQWRYDDFPRNSDGVIQLYRKWQLDNPHMVKLREIILDVGEHGKEEVLTLLKDAGLLDEVWAKTHDHSWYVEKVRATHKEGKTCYPGCPFCKGTSFTGAIHCEEDHKFLKAQEQKRGTRHINPTTGLPTTMVQPSRLNEQQHAEQAWGLHPTCAQRHAVDTLDKMRNGKGDYNFRQRVQYAFLVVLVLHVNGYTCKHTGVEITWDTFTAFDTEHPAMGMNVMIDGEEFPTRKIMCISEIWDKSWGSFSKFFDALCREVTVTYVVNRMAHRLIGYGHHEKRCFLFPKLLPFPFEKVELDGRTVLEPKSLPPANSTTTTSVKTVSTISTTISSSTINVTTATTTNKSTNLKSITKPVFDNNELEALKAERIRIEGVINNMKMKKEVATRKRKSREANEEESLDQGIAGAPQAHVATVNVASIAVSDDGAKTTTVEESTPRTGSFSLFLNQLVMYDSTPCKIVGFSVDRSMVTVLGKDSRVEVDVNLVKPVSSQSNTKCSRVMLHSDCADTKQMSCIPKLESLTNDERKQINQPREEARQFCLEQERIKAELKRKKDEARKQERNKTELKRKEEEALLNMAEARWQAIQAKRIQEERLENERIAKIEEQLEQERIAKMVAAPQQAIERQQAIEVARQKVIEVARQQAQQLPKRQRLRTQQQVQQQAQQQQAKQSPTQRRTKKQRLVQEQFQQQVQLQAQRQRLRKEITRAQFNDLLKEGQTVKYCFSPVQIVGLNTDRTIVTIRTATGYNMEVIINQITPNDVNLRITPS